jgi:surface protein
MNFTAETDSNNEIKIKSDTNWKALVTGNFSLSSYNGYGDKTISVIPSGNYLYSQGNITFIYGESQCYYQTDLDVNFINESATYLYVVGKSGNKGCTFTIDTNLQWDYKTETNVDASITRVSNKLNVFTNGKDVTGITINGFYSDFDDNSTLQQHILKTAKLACYPNQESTDTGSTTGDTGTTTGETGTTDYSYKGEIILTAQDSVSTFDQTGGTISYTIASNCVKINNNTGEEEITSNPPVNIKCNSNGLTCNSSLANNGDKITFSIAANTSSNSRQLTATFTQNDGNCNATASTTFTQAGQAGPSTGDFEITWEPTGKSATFVTTGQGIVGSSTSPINSKNWPSYAAGVSMSDKITSATITNKLTSFTTMKDMFQNCSSLTALTVSNFDSSTITNMESAFYGCSNLSSIEGSKTLVKENVTTLERIFYGCSLLSSIDASSWNTSQISTMASSFYKCPSLSSIDTSSWNIENVKSMASMFANDIKLTSFTAPTDTTNIIDLSNMFYECESITKIDLSKLSKIGDIQQIFSSCSKLTDLTLPNNFVSTSSTSLYYSFYGCSKLTSLDVSHWNTSEVTDMWGAFQGCPSLSKLDVSNWNVEKVTQMQHMFENCTMKLDISKWKTTNLTATTQMFNSYGYTTLDFSSWITTGITSFENMFIHSNLTDITVSEANKDFFINNRTALGLPSNTIINVKG